MNDVDIPVNSGLRTLLALAGGYLVADDFEDFMKFDRLHHWHAGAAMLLAAMLPFFPPPLPPPEPVEP